MFVVKLAGINICIDNRYEYVATMCRDYLTTDSQVDFVVSVTEEEIRAEQQGTVGGMGYLESLAIYRKIADKMTDYNGFLMHGVVIETNAKGIAFLAKSGVGKTTHTRFWKAYLGDKMEIINGDKPLIRIIDEKAYAFGTPWAGKEDLQTNKSTQLKHVCFIERAKTNTCVPVKEQDILKRLIMQIYMPKDRTKLIKTFELIDQFAQCVNFHIIRCNLDPSAAQVAYEGLGL